MAKKTHWSTGGGSVLAVACGISAWQGSARTSGPRWFNSSASVYLDLATANPNWYCATCTKAAHLALAKDSAPKPTPRPARSCSNCRSGAINPGHHGRAEDTDLDLCDVCYWRKRAPEPRPIGEARDNEILGYCPNIGWRRLSRIGQKWGLTGAEHIADYEPTHFLPLPPSPEVK